MTRFIFIFVLASGLISSAIQQLLPGSVLKQTLSNSAYAQGSDEQRFNTVRDLLLNDSFATFDLYSELTASDIMSLPGANGSWDDVDYQSQIPQDWAPSEHLRRLNTLSRAYTDSNSTYFGDSQVLTQITNGLEYWNDVEPTSTNWWRNEVNRPGLLKHTLLMLGEDLDSNLVQETIGINWDGAGVNQQPNWGQNLVWRSLNVSARAAIEENGTRLDNASLAVVPRIEPVRPNHPVIREASGGGIMYDWSYAEHGRIPYAGGYGIRYVISLSQAALISEQTRFPMTPYRREVLSNFLLDGQQLFIRGDHFDYNTTGRNLSREQTSLGEAGLIIEPIRLLRQSANLPRGDELDAMLGRLDASMNGQTHDYPEAHRHYWITDISVQQRQAYSSSVNFATIRTIAAETLNDEGLRSRYQGDGVQFVYAGGHGEETAAYDGIFPLWNWRELPGTTLKVRDNQPGIAPHSPPQFRYRGTTQYGNGVSDGKVGVTSFKYDRDRVAASKSYFFGNDYLVNLGSDVTAELATDAIRTTMNQVWFNGPVTVGFGDSTQSYSPDDFANTGNGLWEVSDFQWIHHDNIAYILLDPLAASYASIQTRQGRWTDINPRESDRLITGDIFTVGIDHGFGANQGSYAYAMVPGLGVDEVASYIASLPFEILMQDESAHAIRDVNTEQIQASVFETSVIEINEQWSLEVQTPSVLQIDMTEDELLLNVASLVAGTEFMARLISSSTAALASASTLGGGLADLVGFYDINLSLPSGNNAGSSLSYVLDLSELQLIPAPTGVLAGLTGMAWLLTRRRSA